MIHSLHVMFGETFRQTLQDLKTYTIKYGEADVSPYIQTLLWTEKKDVTSLELVQLKQEKESNVFISGVEDSYEVEFILSQTINSDDHKEAYIYDFFDSIYKKTISVNNPDENQKLLHLVFYLPLYDHKVWLLTKSIIEIIKTIPLSFHIDIVGLAADTAFLFTPKDELNKLPILREQYHNIEKKVIQEVVDFKTKQSAISNFMIMQNCQSEGLSLQLNSSVFLRIIGELACIWSQHYYAFASIPSYKPIKAIGLSALIFDKYYFVQYLLKRTYINLLEKEKITQKKIDITKAAYTTQNLLKDKIYLFSEFWKKEIKPRLDQNVDSENIIVEITPKIDVLLDEVNEDLQSFLFIDDFSLPEKKAIMALLLGLDNEMFTGHSFNKSQLIIDDLETEVVDVFINAYNDVVSMELSSTITQLSAISNEKIVSPLPEIKRIREEIRETTTYIRSKKDQLNKIEIQQEERTESGKRLTNDGVFTFDDENKFKLLPKEVEEITFDKKYEPSSFTTIQNVDLRETFTKVKNQGQMGACTAFTLVGIYEYLLNLNQKEEYDLSEGFLYYNSRKRVNQTHQDNGSNFPNAVSAFEQDGVCLEKFYPYEEGYLNKQPSENAYKNAENYKIREIEGVDLDLDHIKTALAEGFPIAISLRIYDSFGSNSSGFIYRPSDSEIKSKEYGNHAMIVCGYSEERKVFIVRNSWGETFGDKGYCYISYSYIEDKELLNSAFIVTKIESDLLVNENAENTQVFFDVRDANILYAITKNLLEVESIRLIKLERKDILLRGAYLNLIEKLKINRIREELIKGKGEALEKRIDLRNKLKQEQEETKRKEIKAFDAETRSRGIIILLISIGIIVVLFGLCYLFSFYEMISKKESWIALGISTTLILLLFISYFPLRKRKKFFLEEELNNSIIESAEAINKYKKELSFNRLKMYTAGRFLDKLFNLSDKLKNKYNVMESFVGNLLNWYTIEVNEVQTMDAYTPDPFISLLTNEKLDEYFNLKKESIIQNINLSDFIKAYTIKEEEIVKFKTTIKNTVINSLYEEIRDFKIIDHILNKSEYDYLDKTYTNHKKLLPILDNKSNVFLQIMPGTTTEMANKIIFIHTTKDIDKKAWDSIYTKSFSMSPSSEVIFSPYKIIIVRSQNLELKELVITR